MFPFDPGCASGCFFFCSLGSVSLAYSTVRRMGGSLAPMQTKRAPTSQKTFENFGFWALFLAFSRWAIAFLDCPTFSPFISPRISSKRDWLVCHVEAPEEGACFGDVAGQGPRVGVNGFWSVYVNLCSCCMLLASLFEPLKFPCFWVARCAALVNLIRCAVLRFYHGVPGL